MFINKLKAFIPQHIQNKTVIGFFEFFRKVRKIFGKALSRITQNAIINREYFSSHGSGLIENQNAYSDMKFGRTTIRYAGCEIIAAYNALLSLGEGADTDFVSLISEFEKDGMIFGGLFGTSPKAIFDYFIKRGFEAAFTVNESEFEAFSEKYDTLILTMYNNSRNIMEKVHTISITKTDELFTAHNTYGNGITIGPYASLSTLLGYICGGNAKGISLIGIQKTKVNKEKNRNIE